MAALPDEILELLSTHGPVSLEVGGGPDPVSEKVSVAPLNRQLYAFVRPGSPLERALEAHGTAVLGAEDPAGGYLLRLRTRATLGRPVTGEARRAELMYWLPAGARPNGLIAARLHPESLDYTRGKGKDRNRVEGDVPGGALPGAVSRWARLGREGVVGWYPVLVLTDWIGVVLLGIPEGTRALIALLMIVAGLGMLGGVAVLNQWALLVRYREGLATEAEAALGLEGWAAPDDLWAAGWAGVVGGLLLSLLLGAGAGWSVAALSVGASGLLVFGPFYGIRHLFRKKDEEAA